MCVCVCVCVCEVHASSSEFLLMSLFFKFSVRRGFFYLLDYVTPTEIFQIGDRKIEKKITCTPFVVVFT